MKKNTKLKTENIAVTTEHTVPDNYFVKLKTDVVFKKLFGSEEIIQVALHDKSKNK